MTDYTKKYANKRKKKCTSLEKEKCIAIELF